MLNGPIKLAAVSSVVAIVAAMALSKGGGPASGTAAVSPSQQSRQASWPGFSALLDRFGVRSPLAISGGGDVVRSPSPPANGFGPVRLSADSTGHYLANVEIEARRFKMLVDTGATLVTLTSEDAAALGVKPAPADYNTRVGTVNGAMMTAKTQLREVRIGNIVARDVAAIVAPPGKLEQSLLGMSFLSQLRSFEIADRSLVLNP